MPANSDFKVKQGLRIGTKITSYNNNTAITNGQILIGNTTSGSFDVATITQGANLVITNAGGSITIAANANTSNSSGTLVLRGADGSFTANIVSVGGILSTGANGVSTIGNATAYFGNIFGKAIIASTLNDSIGSVRDLPLNTQTTLYTLATTDNGKLVTSNVNVTVPNSVFSSGQTVSLYNNSAASWTLIQSTNVTMYLAGTASTGNRTLSQRGLATVICVAANTFVVSGAGLS